MRGKIAITGASALAAETAERVLEAGPFEVVLLDADTDAAQASAGDLAAAAAARAGASVAGGGSWDAAAGAGLVVVCDGDPSEAGRMVAERCPGATVVVASDPAEEACAAVLAAGAFPRARVVGIGGAVEALRLRAGVARELRVSAADVSALVLGGRGTRAVPLLGSLRAGGSAVADKLPAERIAAWLAEVRGGAPAGVRTVAAATALVVAAIAADTRAVVAVTMLCDGELGIERAVAGVPVVLGAAGIEQVLDVVLSDDEREALAGAAVPYRP